MPMTRPISELLNKINSTDSLNEKAELTTQLAHALIGKLWLFDLQNILSPQFVPSEQLSKNLDDVIELFKSPEDLMLSFNTTLHFVPVKSGYKFNLSNDHRLAETETLLIAQGDHSNVLIPLHNLFRLLDGEEPVYPVYLDWTLADEVKLQEMTEFQYFTLSQAETHHNHKLIQFTRPDLLAKLNDKLANPNFNLGKQMYDFLMKGKHGTSFKEKSFKSFNAQ